MQQHSIHEMKSLYKKLSSFLLILIIFTIGIATYTYKKVVANARPFMYSNVQDVPAYKAGLVLGTSRYLNNGTENLFFTYRIQAAVDLYKAGKVKYLIVSGDNSIKEYNETGDMRAALMEKGVPDSAIVQDYAGFRTLDSIFRCKDIFGQSSFIIISQPFHNERALYLAQHHGIQAVAYNAYDITGKYGYKTKAREVLARVKLMLDIHVLHTQPKFGGQKVVLGA